MQWRIRSFVNLSMENIEVMQIKQDFLRFLNPPLRYEVTKLLSFDNLRDFWMFEKADFAELTLVTSLLKTQLVPPYEKIISQGDLGDKMYIIMKGKVRVSVNCMHRRIAN